MYHRHTECVCGLLLSTMCWMVDDTGRNRSACFSLCDKPLQSSLATANPAIAKTLPKANAAATPDRSPHKSTPPQRIFTTAIANAKGLPDSLYAGALWSVPVGLRGAHSPRVGHVHAGSHQLLRTRTISPFTAASATAHGADF
jgi:hypothetical protein